MLAFICNERSGAGELALSPSPKNDDVVVRVAQHIARATDLCQRSVSVRSVSVFVLSICAKYLCQAFVRSICAKDLCERFTPKTCANYLYMHVLRPPGVQWCCSMLAAPPHVITEEAQSEPKPLGAAHHYVCMYVNQLTEVSQSPGTLPRGNTTGPGFNQGLSWVRGATADGAMAATLIPYFIHLENCVRLWLWLEP